MPRKLARNLATLLLATYGLIAVVGSGGAHRLGGIPHRRSPAITSCVGCGHGHSHAMCGTPHSSPEEGSESAEVHVAEMSSEGACPICHWFSQCKSEPPAEPPRLAVAACEERLSHHRQCLSIRSLYRPSRPRGPPVSG